MFQPLDRQGVVMLHWSFRYMVCGVIAVSGCRPTSTPPQMVATLQMPILVPPKAITTVWPAGSDSNQCFGIPNDFSGSLTDEQERDVPQLFHHASQIEAVQVVTPSELKQKSLGKQMLLEEIQGGQKYVALADTRCVQLDENLRGVTIIIERYRIDDEVEKKSP